MRWAWFARLWRTQSETVVDRIGPVAAASVFEPVLDAEGMIDVDRTVEKYNETRKWGAFMNRRAREEHLQWVRETYEELRQDQERGP